MCSTNRYIVTFVRVVSDFQKLMTYASQHHQGQLMANFQAHLKVLFILLSLTLGKFFRVTSFTVNVVYSTSERRVNIYNILSVVNHNVKLWKYTFVPFSLY